jgi:hypothetical protein
LNDAGTGKFGGFQLGTSTTAGYVLTADASGVGTWQSAGAGSQTPWGQNIDAAGYNLTGLGDGTRTVDLCDGTYAVNATGTSYFINGSTEVTLTNGSQAGIFTDGIRTVNIATGDWGLWATDGASEVYLLDGTYAINAIGNSLFTGDLTTTGTGTFGYLTLPASITGSPVSGSCYWDEANNYWYIYNDTTDTWKYVELGGHDLVNDLTDLEDLNIGTPESGQVLKYNSTSGKWENGTGGSGAAWGDITGTLSAQYDLQGALDAKTTLTAVKADTDIADAITKKHDGGTQDTAIGLKAPTNAPTFTGIPAAPTATAGTNTTQLATTQFVTAINNNARYTTVKYGAGSHTAAKAAGNYIFPPAGGIMAVGGTGTLYPLQVFYLTGADFPTINGIGTKLRVKGSVFCNDVAPFTGTFTFGLHPITRPATSGGAGVCIYTVGTVVSGSNGAVVTNAVADSSNNAIGADFAIPADGWYALVCVTNATMATSAHVHLTCELQMRN